MKKAKSFLANRRVRAQVLIRTLIASLVLAILVGGCSLPASLSAPTATQTETATPIPPTDTPVPTPTATQIPTDTPTVTLTSIPTETPTPSETPTSTMPPPTPSGEDAIYVYYIQLDTDGPVACGDSLVPLNTGMARTGNIEADVTTALSRLFYQRQFFGNLYNALFRSNMSVNSVEFEENTGLINVYLDGTYVRSDDRCDDRRVRAQVWTTIKQFKEIKSTYVLLRTALLGDLLDTK